MADVNDHLSRISTLWTMVVRAHGGPGDGPSAARGELMGRYFGAAYRFLLASVRDPDAAHDLAQEFAVRFLRGDFRRADPGRGRFRDYVKRALVHLVTDHHRARLAWGHPLTGDVPAPAEPDTDRPFLESWRDELLARTWAALAEAHPSYYAALLLRVEQPDLSSAEMAERLTAGADRPATADGVRKALERGHKKFADLLLDEVARSLGDPAAADLEAELRDLDLLQYCRSALARRAACPA